MVFKSFTGFVKMSSYRVLKNSLFNLGKCIASPTYISYWVKPNFIQKNKNKTPKQSNAALLFLFNSQYIKKKCVALLFLALETSKRCVSIREKGVIIVSCQTERTTNHLLSLPI